MVTTDLMKLRSLYPNVKHRGYIIVKRQQFFYSADIHIYTIYMEFIDKNLKQLYINLGPHAIAEFSLGQS